MRDKIMPIVMTVFIWFFLTLIWSAGRTSQEECALVLPIDYVLYGKWFCPIEPKEISSD